MKKAIEIIQFVLIIFLIIFGLIILYQIILKIFGGSWETEAIIIALLILNISFTFALALNQAKSNADAKYMRR